MPRNNELTNRLASTPECAATCADRVCKRASSLNVGETDRSASAQCSILDTIVATIARRQLGWRRKRRKSNLNRSVRQVAAGSVEEASHVEA